MKSRKWLVISYFSGVDTLACSHHIDDRLDVLAEYGVETVVLSSLCSPGSNRVRVIRVPSAMPSGIKYELRYLTRNAFGDSLMRRLVQTPLLLALLPSYALESLILNFECTWSWFPFAAARAIREIKRGDYELIYSTGGPPSAHLAGYLCAKATGISWVAEFQDPVVGDWFARRRTERRYNAWLERLVAGHADATVYLTKAACDEAKARIGGDINAEFIIPGASASIRAEVCQPKRNKLILGHFGSLRGDRNAGILLNCIRQVIDQYPCAANEIEMRFYGDMDSAQASMIKSFEYQEMLKVMGKVSRAESLAGMQECDVLVCIQNASCLSAVTIPSKVYEYMILGKQVLNLSYDNLELDAMLRELGHYSNDMRDTSGVCATLVDLYKTWLNARVLPAPKPSPYTTHAAAQELIKLTDLCLIKRNSKHVRKKLLHEG